MLAQSISNNSLISNSSLNSIKLTEGQHKMSNDPSTAPSLTSLFSNLRPIDSHSFSSIDSKIRLHLPLEQHVKAIKAHQSFIGLTSEGRKLLNKSPPSSSTPEPKRANKSIISSVQSKRASHASSLASIHEEAEAVSSTKINQSKGSSVRKFSLYGASKQKLKSQKKPLFPDILLPSPATLRRSYSEQEPDMVQIQQEKKQEAVQLSSIQSEYHLEPVVKQARYKYITDLLRSRAETNSSLRDVERKSVITEYQNAVLMPEERSLSKKRGVSDLTKEKAGRAKGKHMHKLELALGDQVTKKWLRQHSQSPARGSLTQLSSQIKDETKKAKAGGLESFALQLFSNWEVFPKRKGVSVQKVAENLVALGLTTAHPYLTKLITPQCKSLKGRKEEQNTISKEKFVGLVHSQPKIRKIIEVLNKAAKELREKEKEKHSQKYKRILRPGRRFEDRSEKGSIDSDSGTFSTLERSATIESIKGSSRLASLERSRSLVKYPKLRGSSLMRRKTTLFNVKEMRKLSILLAQRKVNEDSRKILKEMLNNELQRDMGEWRRVKDERALARKMQPSLAQKYGEDVTLFFKAVETSSFERGLDFEGDNYHVETLLGKLIARRENKYVSQLELPNQMTQYHLTVIQGWWDSQVKEKEVLSRGKLERLFQEEKMVQDRRECDELFRLLLDQYSMRSELTQTQYVQLFAKPVIRAAVQNLRALVQTSDMLSDDFPLSLRLTRHQRALFLAGIGPQGKLHARRFPIDGRKALKALQEMQNDEEMNHRERNKFTEEMDKLGERVRDIREEGRGEKKEVFRGENKIFLGQEEQYDLMGVYQMS